MMYFVALKLRKPLSEYHGLQATLKSVGPWSNRMQLTWFIESHLSARRLRDQLKPHMLPGDKLFVAEFNNNWAGAGMGPTFPEWMGRRTTLRKVDAVVPPDDAAAAQPVERPNPSTGEYAGDLGELVDGDEGAS